MLGSEMFVGLEVITTVQGIENWFPRISKKWTTGVNDGLRRYLGVDFGQVLPHVLAHRRDGQEDVTREDAKV